MKIAIMNDPHYGFLGHVSRNIHDRLSDLLKEKVEALGIEALVIAGDIATNKQEQIEAFFKLYRSKIDIPILVVFGNHDYWDDKFWVDGKYRIRGIGELIQLHQDFCKDHSIHYLGEKSIQIDDVEFFGYDGWYNDINPKTNDLHHMQKWAESAPTHQFMNYRAHKDVDRILLESSESKAKTKICVSHFDCTLHPHTGSEHRGPNSHLKALSEVMDIIIYGHTHEKLNHAFGRSTILSTGSDYNSPIVMVVDTDSKEVIEEIQLPWTKKRGR